jgi:hypothetical protein
MLHLYTIVSHIHVLSLLFLGSTVVFTQSLTLSTWATPLALRLLCM